MQLTVLFVTKGRVTGRKDGTQHKEVIGKRLRKWCSNHLHSHTNPSSRV